jgi:hypothetical protein
MKTLRFDAADIRRVVEHSLAAETQAKSLRASTTNQVPGTAGGDAAVPAIVLARDRGVYMMSNGQPRDIVEGERSFVAYALGCDPRCDRDWRSNSRELAGDDDFTLTLPWAENLKVLIQAGIQTISVSIDRNGDRIEVTVLSDA